MYQNIQMKRQTGILNDLKFNKPFVGSYWFKPNLQGYQPCSSRRDPWDPQKFFYVILLSSDE